MTNTPSAGTRRKRDGNDAGLACLPTLNEDITREQGVLKELGLPDTISARERFARKIETHKRLSLGQKEQALYFLLSQNYPKREGYAITRNYIRLCLNPRYTARGTAWDGGAIKRQKVD